VLGSFPFATLKGQDDTLNTNRYVHHGIAMTLSPQWSLGSADDTKGRSSQSTRSTSSELE